MRKQERRVESYHAKEVFIKIIVEESSLGAERALKNFLTQRRKCAKEGLRKPKV
jgi:hypothetical protein